MCMWGCLDSGRMNITFVHDLDTGFLAATLKEPLQKLGHNVKIVQTLITQIEGEQSSHIDIHTGALKTDADFQQVQEVFRETEFFIIRSISDVALRTLKVFDHANHTNAIYKVHGSELREQGNPYSLTAWRTLPHPLVVCGPRDPSLIPLYRGNVITHIERPCDFDIFPKRKAESPPFALHTPTNPARKGTQSLKDSWKNKDIPLEIMSALPRAQILKRKSQASFYIDNAGDYAHGPYGMNSVEAWFYKIPVFSTYSHIDTVLCPELEYLVYNIKNINALNDHAYDSKRMNKCKQYAITTHNKHTIAKQYIALAYHLKEKDEHQ